MFGQLNAHGAFEVALLVDGYFESVLIFPAIYVEALLASPVGYSVFDSRPKHHLTTIHEIEHDIFQFWLVGNWIYQVEINPVIRSDLNADVSFDIVDLASNIQLMKLHPFQFFWLLRIISLPFEKQHRARAPRDQCPVVDQIHIPQVLLRDLLQLVFPHISRVDVQSLSLPIKQMYYFIFLIIKRFIRKVLLRAIEFQFDISTL